MDLVESLVNIDCVSTIAIGLDLTGFARVSKTPDPTLKRRVVLRLAKGRPRSNCAVLRQCWGALLPRLGLIAE